MGCIVLRRWLREYRLSLRNSVGVRVKNKYIRSGTGGTLGLSDIREGRGHLLTELTTRRYLMNE